LVVAANVLLLGYGNRLRRDDGAGPHVAEAVAARHVPGVRCIAPFQIVPELLEELCGMSRVLFIDASHEPCTDPFRVCRIAAAAPPARLSHCGGPAALLTLAQALDGRHPEAWLLTLPAADLGFGEGLSPRMQGQVTVALDWIRQWLDERCTKSA
jgi:hydrogenase maturation protease